MMPDAVLVVQGWMINRSLGLSTGVPWYSWCCIPRSGVVHIGSTSARLLSLLGYASAKTARHWLAGPDNKGYCLILEWYTTVHAMTWGSLKKYAAFGERLWGQYDSVMTNDHDDNAIQQLQPFAQHKGDSIVLSVNSVCTIMQSPPQRKVTWHANITRLWYRPLRRSTLLWSLDLTSIRMHMIMSLY